MGQLQKMLILQQETLLIRVDSWYPGFQSAFNKVTNEASVPGSKLVDNSRIYHSDANYNFRDLIICRNSSGGSFRQYELNSFGRIYTDKDGYITSMVHIHS
jgi:hypothetical protein